MAQLISTLAQLMATHAYWHTQLAQLIDDWQQVLLALCWASGELTLP